MLTTTPTTLGLPGLGNARADRVSNRRFRRAPDRRASLTRDVSSTFAEAMLVGFERETLATVVMKN